VVLVMLILVLAACASGSDDEATVETQLVGNAERGAELYTATINRQPSCASCHSLDGTELVGPTLAGFGEVAGERVADQSAAEYAHLSIVEPGDYLVDGYQNVMPATYDETFTEQQIADLVAFILSQ
jgi:cytochrome c oxidase subunit 2